MLTAEIKVNGKTIATIDAINVRTISDKPGDFIGDRAVVCEYEVTVSKTSYHGPNMTRVTLLPFTVTHDRRFGWQGLINKITAKITPIVIETINEEES